MSQRDEPKLDIERLARLGTVWEQEPPAQDDGDGRIMGLVIVSSISWWFGLGVGWLIWGVLP